MRYYWVASKPEDPLKHYGVKGMKWHKHFKSRLNLPGKNGSKSVLEETSKSVKKQTESSPRLLLRKKLSDANSLLKRAIRPRGIGQGYKLSENEKRKLGYFISHLGFGNSKRKNTRY